MIVRKPLRYLAGLSAGRFVLWCYFIWWGVVLVRYFDPSPRVWLTSLGLSLIIGFALFVNTTASGNNRLRLEPWPTFRLFVTPFCVSSFAALVKGRGFILIFSPKWEETGLAIGLCALLGLFVLGARAITRGETEGTHECPNSRNNAAGLVTLSDHGEAG